MFEERTKELVGKGRPSRSVEAGSLAGPVLYLSMLAVALVGWDLAAQRRETWMAEEKLEDVHWIVVEEKWLGKRRVLRKRMLLGVCAPDCLVRHSGLEAAEDEGIHKLVRWILSPCWSVKGDVDLEGEQEGESVEAGCLGLLLELGRELERALGQPLVDRLVDEAIKQSPQALAREHLLSVPLVVAKVPSPWVLKLAG